MPLEGLYLLLITNKNSNIIEDIEILNQMQKIVLKVCNKGINEKQISKHAFDLIMSFDDLITINGYRDSVTMSQLEAYLDMDSTDEKMHKKMRMIREKEAKDIAKKQQKEIAKKQKDDIKTKKEMGITEDFEETNKFKPSTPEKPKEYESKAPVGKGMQLGKPKKMPGGSKIPSKFDFGTKNVFDKPDIAPEPKLEIDAQPKVDLNIHEFVN